MATSPSTASNTSSALTMQTMGANASVAVGSMVSSAPLPMPSLSQLVTVKLTKETHLLWKAQIVPVLKGHQLYGFVDGTIAAPPKLAPASSDANAEQVANPRYAAWVAQDALVLSGILSTLSPEVLARVALHTSPVTVWAALERMFASQSKAKIMQLRKQLATIQKKEMSMTEYFGRVKMLADMLASAGRPVSDDDVVIYLLTGLDSSYDPLVTSVTTLAGDVSLDDLFAHMLDYELRQENNGGNYHMAANHAGRGPGGGRGGGRGGGNGGRGQGRGGGNQGGNGGRGYGNQGGNGYNSNSGGFANKNTGNKPRCQICSKLGHEAIKCYNRFNQNYQPEEPRAANNVSTNNQGFDPVWYTDTGATDHITGELDKLTIREPYMGKDQVHTANGSGSGYEEGSSSRAQ